MYALCDQRLLGESADWVEPYRIFWEQALHRLDQYLRASQAKNEKHHEK